MIKRYYWISFEESAYTDQAFGYESCFNHTYQIAIEGSPFVWWKENRETKRNVILLNYSHAIISGPTQVKCVMTIRRELISFTEISKPDYDIACEMDVYWKDPKETMKDEW